MNQDIAYLELNAVKSAFSTLRKLGYTYTGSQYWQPPSETLDEAVALKTTGWYMVWSVRNGKKRSSPGYACNLGQGDLYFFSFKGEPSSRPAPYGTDTIGYEKCKAPFKPLEES